MIVKSYSKVTFVTSKLLLGKVTSRSKEHSLNICFKGSPCFSIKVTFSLQGHPTTKK